jgi:hypothetical protein
MLTDTPSYVDALQAKILDKKSNSDRFRIVRNLSQTVINLSKSAIAKANPTLSQEERLVLFVKVHHGDELARCVKDRLERSHDMNIPEEDLYTSLTPVVKALEEPALSEAHFDLDL